MRNPAGYGGIRKLSGNRRKPYAVLITTGYDAGENPNKIDFLQGKISDDLFLQVQEEYINYCSTHLKAKQKQTAIGYYATKKEAMIALAEYNKNPFDLNKSKATFEQIYYLILPEIEKKTPKTVVASKTAFKHCEPLHKRYISELVAQDLQAVVDSCNSSKSYQMQTIALIRKIFNYAEMNDIITKNYAKFLKITSTAETREKQPFTAEEIKTLWDNIDFETPKEIKGFGGTKYVDVLLILIYTGLRIGELLALDAEHIHIEERYIEVHGTKTKNAVRTVPIHKDILPLLEKRVQDGLPLICTKRNKRIHYQAFQKVFAVIMERLEMNHTIHDTRHTFISFALKSNLNPIIVKKIVGHSSNDITVDTYTHTFIEQLIEEIDKFEIK